MLRGRFTIPWRSLAGSSLLAVMLFYVSGAALLAHIEFAHRHRGAVAAGLLPCVDAQAEPCHREKPAPTDAPPSPSPKHCRLCDMLTSAARSAVVVDADVSFVTTLRTLDTPAPDSVPAGCFYIACISRRGPPSLG